MATMLKGFIECTAGVVTMAAKDYVAEMEGRKQKAEDGFTEMAQKVLGRPKVRPPWYLFWRKSTDRALTTEDVEAYRNELDTMWMFQRDAVIAKAGFDFEWPRLYDSSIENGKLIAQTMARFAPNDTVLVKLKDARWLGLRTKVATLID